MNITDHAGYPVTVDGLKARHRQWLFQLTDFADGLQIEARRTGTREWLVRATAAELSAAIDRAEAGWDWSAWAV
jgi:hypothetical protein